MAVAASINDSWKKNLNLVPSHLVNGMKLYIEHGIPPGDFLQAVLRNDLMESMGRADEESRNGLFNLCTFLYSHAPFDCHGSEAKYKAWVKNHGLKFTESP